jgi:putative peptidoglycan lipid II flippase
MALRRLPGAVGRIRIGLFDGDFREYVWLALPLMLGLGLTTVDEWYEKWVGGQIAAGAISAITYARKLMMAPVGIVGQAVGAALLPTLTVLYQRKNQTDFTSLFTNTLRTTMGLGILAAGALAVLALPVVQLIYERGEFKESYSQQVAVLLQILACAVPGWVTQQVGVRGFYARGEMWRAMILSTVIALSVFPFYLWGGKNWGITGLAIASVTAITINAGITLFWLRIRCGAPHLMPIASTLLRTLTIAAAAGTATYLTLQALNSEAWMPLLSLALGGLIFGALAMIGIWLIGDVPVREGLSRLAAKLNRRSKRSG